MAVELWLVWERFVAVRQVMDWCGSQGDASSGTASSGGARQSRLVKASFGTAVRGEFLQSRRVIPSYGIASLGTDCHGSHGTEHQPIRKEAQCQHLQTSIHIVRDSISKSLHK